MLKFDLEEYPMKLTAAHMEYFYTGALIRRIYDADTIVVDLDQGFGDKKEGVKLRLFGINAPEVRGPQKVEGKKSRDWLRERLCVPETEFDRRWGWITSEHQNYINLQTIKLDRDHKLGARYGSKAKKGKFGRYLALLWDDDGVNINREIVLQGLAPMVNY